MFLSRQSPGIETTDKWYTLLSKPVYELEVVTVLWNQAVHTDREVTASRQDIIINNKKEKTPILIDVAMPTDRNVVQKEAEKKLKYQSLCMEIPNARPEMQDYTSNNWSHQNCNKRFKGKFGSSTWKIVGRFTTKDSCTWNITYNMERVAV